MNYKARKAIFTQKGLIDYMSSQLRLAKNQQTFAKAQLEKNPENLFWIASEREATMRISELEYFLKLASEALELIKEALGDDNKF